MRENHHNSNRKNIYTKVKCSECFLLDIASTVDVQATRRNTFLWEQDFENQSTS